MLWQYFREGGIMMWPILLCSIMALAIVIERVIILHRVNLSTKKFISKLRRILPRGNAMEVASFCEGFSSPLAQVLLPGILKVDRGKEEIKETIEFAGTRVAQGLEKYLGGLAVLARISTLLGFLGTVFGMIKVFKKILELQMIGEGVNPGALAEGIGNALITTAYGLCVAIPIIILHHYLTSRVDRFVSEIENQSQEFVDILVFGQGGDRGEV